MSSILACLSAQSTRPALEVRLATSEVDLAAVYRLRYQIYVSEMGLLSPDHAFVHGDQLRDGYDARSVQLLLLADGVPAGTARLTRADAGPLELSQYTDLRALLARDPGAVEVTRLMLRRDLRRTSAGPLLFVAMFRAMRAMGAHTVLCAGKVGNLGRYYKNIGLHRVDDRRFTYGLVGSALYQLLALDLGAKGTLRSFGWNLLVPILAALAMATGSLGPRYFRRGFDRTARGAYARAA